jgi:hypothetical protein
MSTRANQCRAQEEVDKNGDLVYRFNLGSPVDQQEHSLESFYREDIRELLKIVRLFSLGQPVIIDAFAFLKSPNDVIEI